MISIIIFCHPSIKMFSCCYQTADVITSSLDECCLISGQSDVIVVKHKSGIYKSTKLYICLGSYANLVTKIYFMINGSLNSSINFNINTFGYLSPSELSSEQWGGLNLKYGKNNAEFILHTRLNQEIKLTCQIYLYTESDRIVVSDVDGTLTKDDIGGLINNMLGNNYLHDGYHELVNGIDKNGYKVVWLTMRSLPLYNFSKNYIREHITVQGPLLMQPQQFFHAFKKQLTRQTSKIKTNLMLAIKSAYPKQINPLVGGLGNRAGDAVAYSLVGIPAANTYIIDTKSDVHKLDNTEHSLTYQEVCKEICAHFPVYNSMKVGIITSGYQKYDSEDKQEKDKNANKDKQDKQDKYVTQDKKIKG